MSPPDDPPIPLPPPPAIGSEDYASSAPISGRSKRRSSVVTEAEQSDITKGIRYVSINNRQKNQGQRFISNRLRSAKYTPLNIVPKALFEQFKRVSNLYFLVIAAISFIPGVSPSTPLANVLPLFVVVGFGFARDIYEDIRRAREDSRQNNEKRLIMARDTEGPDVVDRQVSVVDTNVTLNLQNLHLEPDLHRTVKSRNISVGDIVLVRKGQVFPCDLVLIHSALDGGIAYVSTANLDGESNLKRVVVTGPASHIENPAELPTLVGKIRAQPPTTALYEFEGSIALPGEAPVPLDASNLLLRGSILRNTDYIYGLAVYTGFDTKVALNMRNPPSKMGNVEKKLNWVVLMLFGVLATLVIGFSIASGILQRNQGAGQWYMGVTQQNRTGTGLFVRGLGTFLILFSTIIPISLFVTLEFIRVIQSLFMAADFRMRTKGLSVAAKATNLNEMLGEVEHILSDKTGTLTENIMRYIACSAGGNIYNILKHKKCMTQAVSDNVTEVRQLILAMALCHSVVPEPKDDIDIVDEAEENGKKKKQKRRGKHEDALQTPVPADDEADSDDSLPEYQGQSPDEVALVTSAREYGIALLSRTLDTVLVDHFGKEESYTMLAELEFNSDRKRMSMIMRCPDGKIRMYTKGADTIMLTLVTGSADIATIQHHIDEFAKEGLRTLVFAQKELEESRFNEWFVRFNEAKSSLEDREAKVSVVSAELEQHLEYIATTAVEDKLQDRVPETIKFMREAGIKLWVLTGDKRETAENIGYSANLLDRNMDVRHIKGSTSEDIEDQLRKILDQYEHPEEDAGDRRSSVASMARRLSVFSETKKVVEKELGVIIDGASLHHAIEDHSKLFMSVSDHTKVVICCRVTPLQKALVVRLVREERKSMTLAVGDGGNDVSMIQEAHVGVGIYGKEGTQAARSADYAIGEFKHLLRLTAMHGRYAVVRSSGTINLSFYKNIFFTMTQVFFQAFDFASGQTFNDQWITSAFNVLVTSASPLLFGIFERDLDEGTVARFPSAYAINRDRKLFSFKSVLEYAVLYGLWHAIVVYFGTYLFFGFMKIDFSDGKDSGLYLVGFVVSTIITFMSLFKIMLHSHTLNYIVLLFIFLSLVVYFAVVPGSIYVFSEYPLEGQIEMLFASPTFYLAAFVMIVAGFFVDYAILSGRQIMFPTIVDRLQKWEIEDRKNKKD